MSGDNITFCRPWRDLIPCTWNPALKRWAIFSPCGLAFGSSTGDSASRIQLVRVHSEFVLGIQLHVGQRLELRCVEGRKLRFGRAEFLEMFAGVGESVVIGVADFAIGGDAVAPGQRVSFRGGGDGGFAVAVIALDLGEDVQGVGAKAVTIFSITTLVALIP